MKDGGSFCDLSAFDVKISNLFPGRVDGKSTLAGRNRTFVTAFVSSRKGGGGKKNSEKKNDSTHGNLQYDHLF